MRLALITTMYERHELTEFVLSYYDRLKYKLSFELILVVAGSEGEVSKDIATRNGWNYIEAENDPLSKKHNAVLNYAKTFEPDAVVLIGSDDFISKGIFDLYLEAFLAGVDYFGFTDCYFYDKDLHYWSGYDGVRKDESIGLGRMYSSSLLECVMWDLWGGGNINSGLDGLANKRLELIINSTKLIDVTYPIPQNEIVVDIKTMHNITRLVGMPNRGRVAVDLMNVLGVDLNKLNDIIDRTYES